MTSFCVLNKKIYPYIFNMYTLRKTGLFESSLFKNANQDVLEIIFKNLKTDGQTDERTDRLQLTDATGELKE